MSDRKVILMVASMLTTMAATLEELAGKKCGCMSEVGEPMDDVVAYSSQPVVVPTVVDAACWPGGTLEVEEPINPYVAFGGVPVIAAGDAIAIGDNPQQLQAGSPQFAPGPVTHVLPGVAPSVSTVDLDSRGLPWDGRIHASTKTKCKTGEWKNMRGVDPTLLANVEAELRAAMGAQVPAAMTAPTPAPVAPQAPIAPAAPTPPIVPTAGGPMTFPEFLTVITAKCTSRELTYEQVNQVCKKYELASVSLVGSRPDLIPTIYAELEAIWTAAPLA